MRYTSPLTVSLWELMLARGVCTLGERSLKKEMGRPSEAARENYLRHMLTRSRGNPKVYAKNIARAAAKSQVELTTELLNALEQSISTERLAPYLLLAGNDRIYSVRLYEWNTSLSESFWGLLQGLEVSLRNSIHRTLVAAFARDDWYNGAFPMEPAEQNSVAQAIGRITRDGKIVTPGRVIAELNFGFWVALMGASYAPFLWIPPNFSTQLRNGGEVRVQAIVDATDDNAASLVLSYTDAIVRGYSESLHLDWLRRRGQLRSQPPVAVEQRVWFNENLESQAFIIPGIVAIVMAVVGAFLTSLTIAREWERGTMEQLISTPVSSLEVMIGKLIPYFVIGFFDTAVCTGMAVLWFGVPFRGSLLALFAGSAMFLTVVMSQGFFISVIAKTQVAASQAALISTFLPAFLLSGFLFAIEQMPRAIQLFTYIIPARYYVTLMKAVFLKGTPVSYLQTELFALAAFALLLVFLATRAFHKRLA